MPQRVCLTCGRLYPAARGDRGRCAQHRTTTARGLGWDHQQIRADLLAESDGTCYRCGRQATEEDPLEADHVVPRAAGGPTSPSNARLLHRSCNIAKSSS